MLINIVTDEDLKEALEKIKKEDLVPKPDPDNPKTIKSVPDWRGSDIRRFIFIKRHTIGYNGVTFNYPIERTDVELALKRGFFKGVRVK